MGLHLKLHVLEGRRGKDTLLTLLLVKKTFSVQQFVMLCLAFPAKSML